MPKATGQSLTHRVVLDTNILLSSIFFGGAPRKVLVRLQSPDFLQIVSEPLLNELTRILEHKFRKSGTFITSELQTLRAASLLVEPTETIRACRDPDDDRVLECAVSGSADLIVSGDLDLLVLNPFQRIPILTPRQFLDRFPDTEPVPTGQSI